MTSNLYLGTNLKMYKTNRDTAEYISLLSALTGDLDPDRLQLFVIPSFPAIADASRLADHRRIQIGAQNMHWAESGPFTGEVTPLMLRELSVDIVELGHSERRHVFGETEEMIRLKTDSALRHGFTVLLCVGETAGEKEAGRMDEVLRGQLAAALDGLSPECADRLWIAYEPVWAIGAHGQQAEPGYAGCRFREIRGALLRLWGRRGEEVPLLFGGSVNAENAESYLQLSEVNGLFIGRSAWDAFRFSELIHSLAER